MENHRDIALFLGRPPVRLEAGEGCRSRCTVKTCVANPVAMTRRRNLMDKRLPVLALALGVLAAGCNQTSQQSSSSSSTSSTTATTTPTTTPAATTPEPAATTPDKPAAALPGAPGTGKTHKLPSGLQYIDTVVGSGKMAESGMTVSVHYSGWLTDGTPFDNSYD